MEQCKELWQNIFEDTPAYVDYYFANKAPCSKVYRDVVDDKVVSMAFFTPYTAVYYGEKYNIPYIVGVATKPEYRGEKRMTKLLNRGIQEWLGTEAPLVFLSPAKAAIYEGLGFYPVYQRETTVVRRLGKKHYLGKCWKEMSGEEKEKSITFVAEKLKGFDFYLEHSLTYYEEVEKELTALDGGILTLWNEKQMVAVVNYIHEDEHEITELICDSCNAKKVVESLLAYLGTEELTIDDSYFLQGLQGEGITQTKQKEPYIMIKTKEHIPKEICSCYINDIT